MDPSSGLHRSGSNFSSPRELIRQRANKYIFGGYRKIVLKWVNISSKQSYLTYYVNTINYTQQAAGMQFTEFTEPYSSNYVVIYMTSLWIRGSFGTLV